MLNVVERDITAAVIVEAALRDLQRQDGLAFRRLAARFERRMALLIQEAVRRSRLAVDRQQIETALAEQSTDQLQAAMLPMTARLEQELRRLRPMFVSLFLGARALAARQMGQVAGLRARNNVVSFETGLTVLQDELPTPPDFSTLPHPDPRTEAIRWAEQHAAALIGGLTQESRDAVQLLVANAFIHGVPPRDLAALFVRLDLVGLTVRQAQAVLNLRSAILSGAGKVIHAGRIRIRVPVEGATEAQIQAWTEAYASRLLQQRALNIARTETIAAAAAGQQAFWQQAVDAGTLEGDERRQWSAALDDRVCPICSELHGQQTSFQEPFQSSIVGEVFTPPAHPACRCSVILAIA